MVKNKLALGLLIAICTLVTSAIVFISLSLSGIAPMLKNEITITSETFTKVYDGKSSDVDDYKLKGTLYSGDYLEVTFEEFSGDVGSYTNRFDVVVRSKSGKNVTSNYKINSVFGTITVTQRALRIAVKSESELYDGNTLKAKDYTLTGDLVSGDRLDVTFEGEITEVGEKMASLYAHVYNSSNRDVTSNYSITTEDGYLVKELIPLTITSHDDEKDYDGNPLINDTYDLDGKLLATDTLTVDFIDDFSTVGYTNNEFSVSIMSGLEDVSHHYQVTKKYGTLRINAKDITFTSKSSGDLWTYDGQAHSFDDSEALITSVELADTDEYTVHYTNSVTNANNPVKNTFTVAITDKTTHNDVSRNYNVKYECGIIQVIPVKLTVKTNTVSKDYDGTPLSSNSISYDNTLLLPGSQITKSVGASITNAGSVENVIAIKIYSGDPQTSTNITSNYNIIYDYGTLTVKPRKLTLQASSASKDYDGKQLVSNEWYLINGSTADGEFLHVDVQTANGQSFIGSQATTSQVDNVIKCDIRDVNNTLIGGWENNYDITLISGSLVIRGTQKNVIYIGPENVYLSKTDFDLLPNGKVSASTVLGFDEYASDGYQITCNFFGELTGVGRVVTSIDPDSVIIKDPTGSIVTDSKFEINYLTGVLQVYDNEIVIDTLTATKAYDKTPLTAGAHIADDTVDVVYTVTGSQTKVGVSYNTIQIDGIYLKTDTTHSNNLYDSYKITLNLGTLTVTRAKLVVSTSSDTGSWSAGVHTLFNKGFTVISGLATGDIIQVTKSTIWDQIGDTENILEFSIFDEYGNDVSDNYILDTVNCEWGTLTITA